MSEFRRVTDLFAVAPQIAPADVAEAAKAGFRLIINNRPDGEAPGQPAGASIEAAAHGAGLDYVHIPIAGRPTAGQIEAFAKAVRAADGGVLAFCRSGNRSVMTWALAQAAEGARGRDELVRLAAAAGYDLSSVLPI